MEGLSIGDMIYVTMDHRQYMHARVERIQDGIADCAVEWATIAAITTRLYIDELEFVGGKWHKHKFSSGRLAALAGYL